jgi:hypothetical protein
MPVSRTEEPYAGAVLALRGSREETVSSRPYGRCDGPRCSLSKVEGSTRYAGPRADGRGGVPAACIKPLLDRRLASAVEERWTVVPEPSRSQAVKRSEMIRHTGRSQ